MEENKRTVKEMQIFDKFRAALWKVSKEIGKVFQPDEIHGFAQGYKEAYMEHTKNEDFLIEAFDIMEEEEQEGIQNKALTEWLSKTQETVELLKKERKDAKNDTRGDSTVSR